MADQVVSVSLPHDENGMVGRQCYAVGCGRYFKVKPGTGLKTDRMSCPYCSQAGGSSEFMTKDQLEYARSVAIRQILDPMMRDFKRSVEGMNRPSRNAFIDIRFEVKVPEFRIRHYREKDVETAVTCDACGCEFAVFGVFASCPDCRQINAFNVFASSLELCGKLLDLTIMESVGDELGRELHQDLLGRCVGAFDALGKKLRELRPDLFPANPRNLFQNYDALDKALLKISSKGVRDILGAKEAEDLFRLFQVRHLYEHTLGVVDREFSEKVPSHAHLIGRKYPVANQDVRQLMTLLAKLAGSIQADLFNTPKGVST